VFVTFLAVTVIPVLVFRWLPPPVSSVMLQRALQEREWQDYRWTPLEDNAPSVALAVVAAEDQKFPDHRGFDLKAIEEAWQHNISGGRLRGASTITQQVAKNLFLWEGRSWVRKGMEAWFTLLLEAMWPKERILEVYVNIAETSEGTFGFEAAARRYFGVASKDLTRARAALIAAALRKPRSVRLNAPDDDLLRHRDWVLRQMRQLGGPSYLNGILPQR